MSYADLGLDALRVGCCAGEIGELPCDPRTTPGAPARVGSTRRFYANYGGHQAERSAMVGVEARTGDAFTDALQRVSDSVGVSPEAVQTGIFALLVGSVLGMVGGYYIGESEGREEGLGQTESKTAGDLSCACKHGRR